MTINSKTPMSDLPWKRRAAWSLIAIGVLLLSVYGFQTWRELQFAGRVARGEIQVETLRGWMTLSYVAKTTGVPEIALRRALGVPETGHGERNLRQWFEAAGLDPLAGRQAIEAVILDAGRPTTGLPR